MCFVALELGFACVFLADHQLQTSMLFTSRGVRIGKNRARGLGYCSRPQAEGGTQDRLDNDVTLTWKRHRISILLNDDDDDDDDDNNNNGNNNNDDNNHFI